MNNIRLKVQSSFNPINSSAIKEKITRNPVAGEKGFGEVLAKQFNKHQGVQFSKHASERLEQRNIQLSPQELSRLDQGIDRAAQKGIRETLIMMDNRAFIASVQNKTVITAAIDEQLKDQTFTNIDGAVIV
ncbi:TIGR02530 family flagellar biosynthesis protein [Tindallia californiensis]|uniref:Flagellar operon protein n=1 Tax=Tindallia californiensis TaxID=159292 RepID=A0A1H3NTW2_9FIRM|nr:TIGR02530 family flagellar biosynthesis protein [Tindallia californiensis]SDY91589.1 flagellar operon protein [Tindallia californiensis]